MPSKRLVTPAIVVRRYSLAEADRIVVLFTPENGLVRAVAKGQKRSQKRFAGVLDLLYFLEVDLASRKGELLLLEGARLIDGFAPLGRDLMMYATACHLAETAVAFATENHSDPDAFAALAAGLTALCRGEDPAKVSRVVELFTLRAAGLAPRIDVCALTGRTLAPDEVVAFEPRHGGAVALEKAAPGSLRLSAADRRTWRELLQADLATALTAPLAREQARSLRATLTEMIVYYSGRTGRTRPFAEAAAKFLKENRNAG
jgi:DNA repair protein RecO (recombination protein O)